MTNTLLEMVSGMNFRGGQIPGDAKVEYLQGMTKFEGTRDVSQGSKFYSDCDCIDCGDCDCDDCPIIT